MNPFATHGAISWGEYLAIDPAVSLNFYGQVLGWKHNSMPMPDGSLYHIATVNGTNVGGLMKRPKEDIPPGWGFYVTVQDVRALAAKHASSLCVPLTESPVGPFCGILDPQGGFVYAMQYHDNEAESEGITNFTSAFHTPGLFSWFELHTRNGAAAVSFYEDLFGWTYKESEIPGGIYRQIVVGDAQIGGIAEMESASERAYWFGYVTVDDVDRQAGIAASLGAKILMQPFDFPGVGRMTHILDPNGAPLSLIKYEERSES